MGMLLMIVLALLVLRALSGAGHRRSACNLALWPAKVTPDRRRTAAGRSPQETPEQMLQRLYVDGLLTEAEYEEKLYGLFRKA